MSEKKQEIFDDHAYVSLIEEARKKHLLDGVDCPFIPGRFEDGTPAVYDMTKEGGMAILKSGTTDLYGVPSEVHICLPGMYLHSPFFMRNNPYTEAQVKELRYLDDGHEYGEILDHPATGVIIHYPYFLIKYYGIERKPIDFPEYISFFEEDYKEAREIIRTYPFRILGSGVSVELSEDFIPGSTEFDISRRERTVLISSSSGLHIVNVIRISAGESSRILRESSY